MTRAQMLPASNYLIGMEEKCIVDIVICQGHRTNNPVLDICRHCWT